MRKQAPTFEKEILRETVIVKRGVKYPITPDVLDNCAKQYRRMRKNGMTINVHSGHDHTPETKRGEVLDIYTKKRKDGRVGLFGKICFLPHLSKQMIQTLVSNDVSVELPSELYDAKGNFYPLPVRRVAITPDPAVSGMSPFVQQRDTDVSVPFLSLSINNLTKENESMPNEKEELFDSEEVQDETQPELDEDGDDTEADDNVQQSVIGKKKSAFLDSQLAKTLFDCFGIDPDDYDEQEDLIAELNVRLTDMTTLHARLLAALDIDEDDKNKYELLTERLTNTIAFLEQYDTDGDGEVDEDDIRETVGKAQDKTGDDDDETIDSSLDNLEANDKALQLSLDKLQKKYDATAPVIKGLLAKNRQLELDNLLQTGVINKAVHQKAVKRFVLKLSLNDGFDTFIDGARLNSRPSGGSKTASQQPQSKIDPTTSWVKAAKKIDSPYKRANTDA